MDGDKIPFENSFVIPSIELWGPDKLVAQIRQSEWINDSAKTEAILFQLTSYLVSLDTRTNCGTDFNEFNTFCKKLFESLDIPFFESNNINKALVISTDRRKLGALNELYINKIQSRVDFDFFIYTHIDTVGFTSQFGINKPRTISKKEVIGRGACDMKGQVAATILWLAREKYLGRLDLLDLCFMIGIDEETDMASDFNITNRINAKRVIDPEPTSNFEGVYISSILPYTEHIIYLSKNPSALNLSLFRTGISELVGIDEKFIKLVISKEESTPSLALICAGLPFFDDCYKDPLNILAAKLLSSVRIVQFKPYGGWQTQASTETIAALEKALANNFQYIEHPSPGLLTEGIKNGSPRSIHAGPMFFFGTLLHGNSMVFSIPEVGKAGGTGRHFNEGVDIPSLLNYMNTLSDFVTFVQFEP